MRNFISKNWYKLIVGLSLLMTSFGIMVYSISSATAKNLNNFEHYQSHEYTEGSYVYFISNGIIYQIEKGKFKDAAKVYSKIYFQFNRARGLCEYFSFLLYFVFFLLVTKSVG